MTKLGETIRGIIIGLQLSKSRIIQCYIYTPLGVLLFLAFLYGLNQLILLTSVNFPASVLGMIILFGIIIGHHGIFGHRHTAQLIRVIDIPAGFSLRWLGLFFTPSFITLPLSERISVGESFTIAAVFVIGYLILFALVVLICLCLQRWQPVKRNEENEGGASDINVSDIELQDQPRPELASSSSDEFDTVRELSPVANIIRPYNPGVDLSLDTEPAKPLLMPPANQPTARTLYIACVIRTYFDSVFYTIFTIAGMFAYFATGYGLPLQLPLTVVIFKLALAIPASYKRLLHPILFGSALTVLAIYVLGVVNHEDFFRNLRAYRTGRKYLNLFDKTSPLLPGAGDVFSSLMDVSIAALAVPMYTYRAELKQNYLAIVLANVFAAVVSVLAYPPICYHLGIAASRSLSFAARSATLALAIPINQVLGGSANLVAVIAILSGILGVFVGEYLLKALRVRKDDYLTRGITLGINSSAVGTAYLLGTSDPRAAALSSLSFVLYGTLMIIMVAVPQCVVLVRGWVGL
ncbi:hypothetical protein NADFUDRAFT_68728 [Nadsonia fulvescens var. elongata DSM 6958]|uniref:LrgB-domain-containing protein n=1 Tax=Nadsonia fulvescens var. elongata DSM 6958 TaxID=857566 RepID=A0A1E3PT73_9ASCO|nr:hypothetical protein NADFUDRAFT_68728 [Nadsonia fulvescens var. elongata DSM 6958]